MANDPLILECSVLVTEKTKWHHLRKAVIPRTKNVLLLFKCYTVLPDIHYAGFRDLHKASICQLSVCQSGPLSISKRLISICITGHIAGTKLAFVFRF